MVIHEIFHELEKRGLHTLHERLAFYHRRYLKWKIYAFKRKSEQKEVWGWQLIVNSREAGIEEGLYVQKMFQ